MVYLVKSPKFQSRYQRSRAREQHQEGRGEGPHTDVKVWSPWPGHTEEWASLGGSQASQLAAELGHHKQHKGTDSPLSNRSVHVCIKYRALHRMLFRVCLQLSGRHTHTISLNALQCGIVPRWDCILEVRKAGYLTPGRSSEKAPRDILSDNKDLAGPRKTRRALHQSSASASTGSSKSRTLWELQRICATRTQAQHFLCAVWKGRDFTHGKSSDPIWVRNPPLEGSF